MKREGDKYQFKEPFGREIRKKMIDSQKRTLHGPEKFLKLGQLKPTMLATVGHVATGVIQPEKKTVVKTEKKKEKPKKKKKSNKRKKSEKNTSDVEDKPVEKKAKSSKGESKNVQVKKISDISLEDFKNIGNHFPGNTRSFC